MKFLIHNGIAYLIDGKVAKKATFSVDGALQISETEEKNIEIKGQKYTYDEVMKKLNVRYMVASQVEEEKPEKTEEEPEEQIVEKKDDKKDKKAQKSAE